MAKQVIKRDGTKEPFDENKIRRSVEAAGQDAGLAEDRINAVVDEVSGPALTLAAGKEEMATSELASFILAKLDEVEPAAAQAWRKHDQAKGQA